MVGRRCSQNDERHRIVWNTCIIERHFPGLHCHVCQGFAGCRPPPFSNAGAPFDPAGFQPEPLFQFGIFNPALRRIMAEARHAACTLHRAAIPILSAAASMAS